MAESRPFSRQLLRVLLSAALGSAVFSLYFLVVEDLQTYVVIVISIFCGTALIATTVQFGRIVSAFALVLVTVVGGAVGGAICALLLGLRIAGPTMLGILLGFILSISMVRRLDRARACKP